MKNILTLTVSLMLLLSVTVAAKQDSRMLRFPDIGEKLVVFVYAGDLWSVDKNGGDAKHLTTHKGLELFPKISPDGKWIAFSAEYSGSRQVYVMPATGGTPRQLTFYNDAGIMPPRGGFDHIVLDWTPDSKKILFRANRTPWGKRMGKYYLVSIDGGLEEELPIPESGFGAFSPDGTKICYTPISREFRHWKRYKGGRAADVWTYDLKNKVSERITTFPGTDQTPVWNSKGIYFISDMDLKLNVHRYDPATKKIEQITKHKEFDALWLSGRNGEMVYENGGYIYKLNADTGKTTKLTVNINFDSPHRMPYLKSVKRSIRSYGISPDGELALFGARGDIFTVPAEEGIVENLTASSTREMNPVWSPDGKYIAYYSEKSGEFEIYLRNYKTGTTKQLTKGATHWKNYPVWSPDSSKLLYSDMAGKLRILDIKTGKEKLVDTGIRTLIRSYSFSPDSRWVAYTLVSENNQSAIWVYSVETGKKNQVTADTFSEGSPVFSHCGNYIFFTSDRDFNLTSSGFEATFMYTNPTRLYALYLTKNAPDIFKEDVNKVKVAVAETAKKKSKKKSKKAGTKAVKAIKIDFDGISSRVIALTSTNGRYRNLTPIKGGLLYVNEEGVQRYKLEDKKPALLIKDARDFVVSGNGKKLIYLYKRGKFGITGIAKGKAGDGAIELSGMKMRIDPVKEWNQIYNDAFRIFRDWFYVRNIHNVDLMEVKKRYSVLLPYVSHRADLDYILSEIIGESNTGHTYANWGDFEKVKRVDTGLLGAELKVDSKGTYKIAKIFKGENWNKARRSPLTEQGINVKEGDYLIAIDGVKLTSKVNPYQLLEGKADQKVRVTVSSMADGKAARHYYIKPLKSEFELRYLDWVNSRRAMVDKLSGGKIGYIHVPNTAVEGHRELFRGMYAYHNKEALIIDDRYNGGGFIPDDLTRLLERRTRSYWARQGSTRGFKTPAFAHDGPKAMLINHYSSSGGDCFPYYFRQKKLGTIIGTRTWGGLVGISGNGDFVDGSALAVPSFGIYNEKGEWVVEGVGIYPDIEVYDTPHLIAAGKDPSIEKAIEVLLKQLKEKPAKKVKRPVGPDRSKWIEIDIK